ELPAGKQVKVLLKTRTVAARMAFDTRAALGIEWVLEEDQPADGMDALERAVRAMRLPDGEGYVWAAGEYTDIKQIRQYLVDEVGVDKSRIRAASYWRKEAPATHVNFD